MHQSFPLAFTRSWSTLTMAGSWDSKAGISNPVTTLEKPRTAELTHRRDRHVRRGRPAPSIVCAGRHACLNATLSRQVPVHTPALPDRRAGPWMGNRRFDGSPLLCLCYSTAPSYQPSLQARSLPAAGTISRFLSLRSPFVPQG